ncbi:MAG: sortase [Dehalococcoidia bacterium]|nr:sortase [Dehalococcoidia bacterium]
MGLRRWIAPTGLASDERRSKRLISSGLMIPWAVFLAAGGIYCILSLKAQAKLAQLHGDDGNRPSIGIAPTDSTPPKRALMRLFSTGLIVTGVLMLVAGAAYYGFSLRAEAQLASLTRRMDVVDKPLTASPVYAQGREELGAPREPGGSEIDNGLSRSSGDTYVPPVEERMVTPLPYAAGSVAERIVISNIEVDAPVVATGTKYEDGQLVWETAKHAVGHLKGTAYPGQVGNIVMAGHISSPIRREGNVFSRLPEITLGSQVSVYTPLGRYDYRVVETKVVLPTDTSVIEPTPESRLTLITCVPDLVYTHRLIVIAVPVNFEPS